MSELLFNNRECAIAIWLYIAAIGLLPRKGFRKSLAGLARSVFGTKICFFLLGLIAYVALIVFLSAKLNLWEWQMLKETVYWFFGTAIVIFANMTDAKKDEHFFRKKVVGTLGFAVVLEFVIGLYSFSLPVELILIPSIVLIAGMIVVAETDQKHAQAKKFLKFVMSVSGIFLLLYTIGKIIHNFASFFTAATLKDFLLHPALTIALLPFIYLLALYSSYESLFRHIEFAVEKKSPEAVPVLKRKILTLCHVNLRRLNTLSRTVMPQIWRVTNKEEAIDTITNIRF